MKLIKTWKKLKNRTNKIKRKLPKNSHLHYKLDNCSKIITSKVYKNKKNSKNLKVKHSNKSYCHSKFCYVCFEKSMNPYRQGLTMRLHEAAEEGYYIDFLTLTLPVNTKYEDINETIKKINKDFKKLNDNLKKNYGIIGSCRRLEISFTNKIYIDNMTDEQKKKYKGVPQTKLKYDRKKQKYYFEVLKIDPNNEFLCNIHIHALLVYEDIESVPRFFQLEKLWKKYCSGGVFIKEVDTSYNRHKNIDNIVSYMTKPMDFDLVLGSDLLILNEQLKNIRLIDKTGELGFSVSEIKELISKEIEKQEEELQDPNLWSLVYEYKSVFLSHTYLKVKEEYFENMSDLEKEFMTERLIKLGEMR